MTCRPALLLAAALAACSPSTSPDSEGSAPAAVADPPAVAEPSASPDTLVVSTGDRALGERPVAPVRVAGACPFEGCRYGAWTTSEPTSVYEAAGDTAAAFSVPAGTSLNATEGFVLVTRVGVAVAERPSEVYVSPEDRRSVAPGDTLRVLDYEGEGSYRVWTGGALGFSMDAMATGGADGAGRPFRIVAEPAQQWWARVETPDGRTGWLWMDRTPPVRGADALAGP